MKPGQQIERLCVWVTPHIFQIKYLANMSSKGELWKLDRDNNFVDVILACEDGQWMEGHKFILSGWAGTR